MSNRVRIRQSVSPDGARVFHGEDAPADGLRWPRDLLAIAGIRGSIQGPVARCSRVGVGPIAKPVTRPVGFAIPAVIFSLSPVDGHFYFIGTGKDGQGGGTTHHDVRRPAPADTRILRTCSGLARRAFALFYSIAVSCWAARSQPGAAVWTQMARR